MRDFYIYGRSVYGDKQGIGRKLFGIVIQNSHVIYKIKTSSKLENSCKKYSREER